MQNRYNESFAFNYNKYSFYRERRAALNELGKIYFLVIRSISHLWFQYYDKFIAEKVILFLFSIGNDKYIKYSQLIQHRNVISKMICKWYTSFWRYYILRCKSQLLYIRSCVGNWFNTRKEWQYLLNMNNWQVKSELFAKKCL